MSFGEYDLPQVWKLDELCDLRWHRLKGSLNRAYCHVRHYKVLFDACGVHPQDIRSLADFSQVPTTSKNDLRRHYPFGMLAVPLDDIVRVHASSGTSGKPTAVGYTQHDIEVWARLMARSISTAGGSRKDKFHNSYGYGLFTGGLGYHYGAEALGCMVIPFSGGGTNRQVELIRDFRPDIVGATPSYLMAIADEFERQGVDPKTCSLRLAICGGEPWSNSLRDSLEARLGLTALNHYGLSEMMGPGVGQELAIARDGITIWEDHFFPEIIDPVTGAALPDGTFGELVLTSLSREAMPMIRYRTGDLTRLLPGTASCMRRIERITGRSDDMLIIRGVNVFPTQIEAILLKEGDLASHYLIEVDRPQSLDTMQVRVETRKLLHAGTMSETSARVARAIKSTTGVNADVEVLPPGSLPRSSGKAVRVLDRRPTFG